MDKRINHKIYAGKMSNGKFAAELWRYDETPSGAVRPILCVSGKPVFDSAEEASQHLFNSLKSDVQKITEICINSISL